jgi:tetratricopeptide (TPR) repeat protein
MRRSIILTALFCFSLGWAGAFGQAASQFALELQPSVSLPLGRDVGVYALGGGASLFGSYNLPKLAFLSLEAGGGFGLVPVAVAEGKPVSSASMTLLWPWVGIGLGIRPAPWLSLGARASGGWFFASTDAPVVPDSGSNPMFAAGLDADFRLSKALSLGVGAEYRDFLGLYNDLALRLGTAYHFQPPRAGGPGRFRAYKDLVIGEVKLEPVFPVLFKYYDEHPVGSIFLKNKGKIPIEGIKVDFFVNQYMDNPKTSLEIPFLKGGEEIRIDLLALFNDKVLSISEATKVQASLAVQATVAGEQYGAERVETLRVYDRNAIAWSDDRRVAAFVAAKDPAVMRFAKNVASAVKGAGPPAFPDNLLAGMALHDALSAHGMSYQTDPSTPYTQLSKDRTSIDYLQFPGQSLQFKAGDCDDLSILNAALLEALGIETAFITVPGHIYMAFALGLAPAEAARRIQRPADLIVADGVAWVPVEITLTKADFIKAWETGAEEWRVAGSEARLYPVHEAWAVYEPVGFAGSGSESAPPSDALVLSGFKRDLSLLVDRELGPQEAALKAKLKVAQDDPRLANSLGILYARYGLADKAEAQLKAVIAKREFVPALVNLANLRYMSSDMAGARDLYLRANKAQAGAPAILLGLSRSSFELGDYAAAARYYAALKAADPSMARSFAYLEADSAASAATRAADAEKPRRELVWSE